MYIPFIQGTIRYAYKMDKLSGGEKEASEGAVFAAAVLPRIHAADPAAAKTIYDSMKVGATKTTSSDVKKAFESVYPALGITCADVGGLFNEATRDYYSGMDPCVDSSNSSSNNNALAIGLGVGLGAAFLIAAGMVLYMRSREKQGEPVFKTASEHTETSWTTAATVEIIGPPVWLFSKVRGGDE